MPTKGSPHERERTTQVVSAEIFKQVYDSPLSLPGKDRWVTKEADVRTIEKLLGIPDGSIGAPLCVSGDTRNCPKCGRETNWLDIVSSALTKTHQKALLVEVILGERKYVNLEVPRAIADLNCYQCKRLSRTCAVSSAITGRTRDRICFHSLPNRKRSNGPNTLRAACVGRGQTGPRAGTGCGEISSAVIPGANSALGMTAVEFFRSV